MLRSAPLLLVTCLSLAVACGDKETALPEDTGAPLVDGDGDGHDLEADCDDGDPEVFPGAEERCDGVDNDCDGEVDEGVTTPWYPDLDGDGFGDDAEVSDSCEQPSGHVAEGGDCDDEDVASHPGADERCDGADNDCDGEIDEDPVEVWYADADADGFGNAAYPTHSCDPGAGWASNDLDCDDGDAAVSPDAQERCNGLDDDCDGLIDDEDGDVVDPATWYLDTDADGYGLDDRTRIACEQPSSYAALGGDCDDGDSAYHPGALEEDCTDPADYDCDGFTVYADDDGDGWAACVDCDDRDRQIHPAATELCDGVDNDCDGSVDEDDAADASTWYADADRDSYGDGGSPALACTQPSGFVSTHTDCDDHDDDIHPGATELCDGIDNDCDGGVDEDDAADVSSWYLDADADGYGDAAMAAEACDAPSGYVAEGTDCDDGDAAIHPDASELCDGIDNDCDGSLDDADSDVVDAATWHLDYDGDGYGGAFLTTDACSVPSGHVADSSDCDDTDRTVNPGATERCNGVDDDCDRLVDQDDPDVADMSTWYQDSDGDGHGDPGVSTTACTAASGTVADATDCDDSDAAIHPGADEWCNGFDDDCDGVTDTDALDVADWYPDADGDGYGDADGLVWACSAPAGHVGDSGDCDDSDAGVSPDATESCSGVDEDCDGSVDEGWYGLDVDCPAIDCADVLASDASAPDGSYWLDPDGTGPEAWYCELSASDGPWTWTVQGDLAAYWSFDGADVTASDVGGYSGSTAGVASRSSTVPFSGFGSSLYADNNDSSYVQLSGGVTLGSTWTVIFWAHNDSCSNNQIPILFSDNSSFLADLYHSASFYLAGSYRFRNTDSSCSSRVGSWTHHAYTDDGSQLRVWVDGVEQSPASGYSYYSAAGYTIDKLMSRPGFGTNGLSGYLDDLAIFDRALTEEEILRLYDQANDRGRPLRW
jgi:hypothetical protein